MGGKKKQQAVPERKSKEESRGKAEVSESDKKWKNQDKQEKQEVRKGRNRVQYGGEKWNTDFKRFNDQVGVFNLYIKDVAGDGNCLFRSVSDQIDGYPDNHIKIRERCIDFILRNRESFEPFIEDDVPFDKYLANMAKNGTWGGNIEIQAMSMAFNINITIHQLDSPRWEVNNFGSASKFIQLSYHDGEHYNSVRTLGERVGVPAPVNFNIPTKSATTTSSKPKNPTSSEAPTQDELIVMRATEAHLEAVRDVLEQVGGDVDAAIEFIIATKQQESFGASGASMEEPQKQEPPKPKEVSHVTTASPKVEEKPEPKAPPPKDIVRELEDSLFSREMQRQMIEEMMKQTTNQNEIRDYQSSLIEVTEEMAHISRRIQDEKRPKTKLDPLDDEMLALKISMQEEAQMKETQRVIDELTNGKKGHQKEAEKVPEVDEKALEEERKKIEKQEQKHEKHLAKLGQKETLSNRQRKRQQQEVKKEKGQQKAAEKKAEREKEERATSTAALEGPANLGALAI